MPGLRLDGWSDNWGEGLLSLEKENSSDFEKQSNCGKVPNNASAMDETDSIHKKMMEFKPLLEVSQEPNIRSIDLTYGVYPCHRVAQTEWYSKKSSVVS